MGQTENTQAFVAKGVSGQLIVTPTKIVISHKWWSVPGGAAGKKEIRIEQISAIQYKPVSIFTRGYIRFSFQGGQENKRGGTYNAVRDENAIAFKGNQQKKFLQAKELIEQYQAALLSRPAMAPPTSGADELEKLAGLRDRGIITPAEFEAKKKQILGL